MVMQVLMGHRTAHTSLHHSGDLGVSPKISQGAALSLICKRLFGVWLQLPGFKVGLQLFHNDLASLLGRDVHPGRKNRMRTREPFSQEPAYPGEGSVGE